MRVHSFGNSSGSKRVPLYLPLLALRSRPYSMKEWTLCVFIAYTCFNNTCNFLHVNGRAIGLLPHSSNEKGISYSVWHARRLKRELYPQL